MWIGSIRVDVKTKDQQFAGTDSLVRAVIVRDGAELLALRLDWPTENDLERGAFRDYTYFTLPRINHLTPQLPDGIGMSPMPYPDHGIEYSIGMNGHFTLRLRIGGSDMWVKDNVDVYIREVRQVATSFDTLAWQEDSDWTYVASWGQDVAMSTDSGEGKTTWNLNLT
jgi:hypothetical protein